MFERLVLVCQKLLGAGGVEVKTMLLVMFLRMVTATVVINTALYYYAVIWKFSCLNCVDLLYERISA